MLCLDQLVDQGVEVFPIVALAILRQGRRPHHYRQEPLQQSIARKPVQLGELGGLDTADETDGQVADIDFAATDPVYRMRTAVVALEPEPAIGSSTTRGVAVFFHAADPARKLVALDQQAMFAA